MGNPRDTLSRLLASSILFLAITAAYAAEAPSAGGRIVDGTNVPDSNFPTVGKVGDSSSTEAYCSGTLISPIHVLAAGHCVCDDNGKLIVGKTAGRFIIGGQTYSTVDIIVHPTYDGSDSEGVLDLSILVLDRPVPGVTPTPIYRQTPVVGQLLTLAGYGVTGTGSTGVTDNSPVPAEGTINFGTTPIDNVTSTFIKWNFDNRPAPNKESNTAPGDSGGPAFITVNGQLQLAGVTSGGTLANAGFGDVSYDTRVDIAAAWIDSIVGSAPNPNPTPGAVQIVSGPSFTPSNISTNDTVTFTVAANVQNATFQWNFGDGSNPGSGDSVSHTFTSAGTFFVTVNALDGGAVSDTRTISVQVFGIGGEIGGGGGNNSVVTHSKFILNFKRPNASRIDFELGADDFYYDDKFQFTNDVDGRRMEISIGGTRVDELEFFGAHAYGDGSLRWNIRNGTISYRLKSSALPAIFDQFGAKNNDAFRPVTVPISVEIFGMSYVGNYTYQYKARAGRSGSGK